MKKKLEIQKEVREKNYMKKRGLSPIFVPKGIRELPSFYKRRNNKKPKISNVLKDTRARKIDSMMKKDLELIRNNFSRKRGNPIRRDISHSF